MDAFAGRAGDAGGVSEYSKLFRSVVKPALHVGEQIDGRGGWRASDGSGGIAGGETTTGGGGKRVAQRGDGQGRDHLSSTGWVVMTRITDTAAVTINPASA